MRLSAPWILRALPGLAGALLVGTASAAERPVPPSHPASEVPAASPGAARPQGSGGRIFFRYNGVDDNYGRLAWAPLDDTGRPRFAGELRCEVAYATAQRGICLAVEQRMLGLFAAQIFDPSTFQLLGKVPVQGVPSRTRVAPGGALAAFTVFTAGHGYASTSFSTRTALVDVPHAAVMAELESFAVTRDGQPFKNADFNFWGVTFTPDAARFYATLSTGGQYYLIQGDPKTRRATVVHANVECPSLSPDGRQVAYKKRVTTNGIVGWELQTLDLASGRETPLAERRSVDDQLEWLDNRTVLYTVPSGPPGSSPSTDIWRVAADGSGAPQLFLRNASSPAVVR
ncbi:MAG: hypothetical protein JSR54_08740 [Proteobacteria bacterium]|nr:hypothetical protein [Pseudomonadota bacterium]